VKYLLAISIGPVQDFIAAARKTADLYAGSSLLVKIAKAVAGDLHSKGAKLIFPASLESEGANKILVEVDTDNPRALAASAKKKAQETLEESFKQACSKLAGEQKINRVRADIQIESFLEFYSAWIPFDPLEPSGYSEARKQLEFLLAGRKALRDFEAVDQKDEGVPKSPLDPARASIISRGVRDDAPYAKYPLWLGKTEYLDAISLLKRINGSNEKVLDTHTLAQRAIDPNAKNHPPDSESPEPKPQYAYYAVLVADGDAMGKLISENDNVKDHQKLSHALDEFAQKARDITKDHYGHCVYAGGDDVMALLPVNKAISCARALKDAFTKVGSKLSVGIAIVHYLEPLSLSLDAAREAEKAAKNKKDENTENHGNRLAVALHTRGGAPLTVVQPWREEKWDIWMAAYRNDEISRGFAYELRDLSSQWPKNLDTESDMPALQSEAERILKRKRVKDGKEAKLELPKFSKRKDLETFSGELIIARFLSAKKE
jgi:CRISPR-associated protein Cmr2